MNNIKSDELLKTFLRDVTSKNKLNEALEKYFANIKPLGDFKKISEIPFSSERKFSAVIYGDLSLVLGAPEVLLKETDKAFENVRTYTKEAFRVVVFGKVEGKLDEKAENIKDKFKTLMVIAIDDPIREETFDTLDNLAKENIQYRIISGDSPDTVSSIARKINKNYPINAISGEDLDKLQGENLEKAILEHNIFARIKPLQKQTIIKILKKNKLFTIMIGDGANDVLALKESDVGIAMNGGSTMARDVADVVLVNNSFSTLPAILYEGRRIITNIQTIANIYLIKNISSIASILMLGFIGLRFPFDPKHVEIASLIVIGIPSFVLAFEKHKFSTSDEGFIKRLLFFSGVVGFGNALIYTILYTYYDITSDKIFYSRTMLLTSVIFLGINNIILIYLQRYKLEEILRRKIVMGLCLSMVLIFLAVIVFPITRDFFEIKKISFLDLIISFCFSAAGSIFIGFVLKNLKLIENYSN